MRIRKPTLWLTLIMFLFISTAAMAGSTVNVGLSGYIPSTDDVSITYQTPDPALDPDTVGSLVIDAATGGEAVKELELPSDFWISKIHFCLAPSTIPDTTDMTVKIYGINPIATSYTIALFEETVPQASLDQCVEVMVYDPTDPSDAPITPALGPLYLSIGVTGTAYIKSVAVKEFTPEEIVIDGCNTGVVDRLLDDGSLLSEVIDDLFTKCEKGPIVPKNHGQFAKCVSHELNILKRNGDISGREKGKFQKCAAKSRVGKK